MATQTEQFEQRYVTVWEEIWLFIYAYIYYVQNWSQSMREYALTAKKNHIETFKYK